MPPKPTKETKKRKLFIKKFDELGDVEKLRVINNIRRFIGKPVSSNEVNKLGSFFGNNPGFRAIIDKTEQDSFEFFSSEKFVPDSSIFTRGYIPTEDQNDVIEKLQKLRESSTKDDVSFKSFDSSHHSDPEEGIEKSQSGSPIIVANPTKVTAPAKMPMKPGVVEIEDTPSPDRPKSKKANKFFGDENEPSDDDHPSPPARNPNKTPSPSATSEQSSLEETPTRMNQRRDEHQAEADDVGSMISRIEEEMGKKLDKFSEEEKSKIIIALEERAKVEDIDITNLVQCLRNTQTKGLLLHSNTKKFHPDHLRPNPNGIKPQRPSKPSITNYTDMTKPIKLGSVSQARDGLSKFARNMGKK